MPMTRRQFAAAVTATVPMAFPTKLIGAAAEIRRPDDRFLQARLNALLDVTSVPGFAVGVLRDGRLAWERYQGVTEAGTRHHVGADTLFPAASLGKPVFAYAALRLAEQGRLDLDRPLKSYVADHAPADPRGERVTARHVLSHSSGLRNWRNALDQPLVPDFDPGSRFQYSGEGFYYLQRTIEKIAGCSIQQFMEDALFRPFDMPSSTYAWRPDTDGRLVFGHNRGAVARGQRDFNVRMVAHAEQQRKPLAAFTHDDLVAAMRALPSSPLPLPNFIPTNVAGSLLTTLHDFANFLARILTPRSGPAELSGPMREQMVSPQIRLNHALAWGLGWGIETMAGREYLWHWGDNGTFKNFVLAHLPSRSAVVVFTNAAQGMRLAEAIVNAASGSEHLAFDWVG
jgi:CubicO group peptidase (beta-lactamase class C family)